MTMLYSALPHRQPRNQSVLDGRASDSDLPYRQPKIGQEESNLPAEQAVNNQNHQVFSWWFFV